MTINQSYFIRFASLLLQTIRADCFNKQKSHFHLIRSIIYLFDVKENDLRYNIHISIKLSVQLHKSVEHKLKQSTPRIRFRQLLVPSAVIFLIKLYPSELTAIQLRRTPIRSPNIKIKEQKLLSNCIKEKILYPFDKTMNNKDHLHFHIHVMQYLQETGTMSHIDHTLYSIMRDLKRYKLYRIQLRIRYRLK